MIAVGSLRMIVSAAAALGLAAALAAAAPCARAEDSTSGAKPPPAAAPAPGPRDAVAELRPDEVDAIRQRLPDWDRMEPAQRQRVATLVLRLRSLTPEQRESFLEKMRRLGRAGPGAADIVARNLNDLPDKDRGELRGRLRIPLIARAVAIVIRRELPPPAHAALFEGVAPQDQSAIEWAIVASWKRHSIEGLAKAPALDDEPPAGLPSDATATIVRLRDEVRAEGGAGAPQKLRVLYAHRLFEARLLEADALTKGPDPVARAERALAIGRRLRQAFPAAFEAVIAEVTAKASQGREAIDRFVAESQPQQSPQANEGRRARALWEFVDRYERARPFLTAEAREKADDVQASSLRLLRVPEDRVRDLRATLLPQVRWALLRAIADELGFAPGAGRPPKSPRDPGAGKKDRDPPK